MDRREEPPRRRGAAFRARLAAFWGGLVEIWILIWGWLTLTALCIGVPEWLTDSPEGGDTLVAVVFFAVMTGVGWLASRPWRKRLPEQKPAVPQIPPGIWVAKKEHRLPRPGSSARGPMRQLSEAEYALAEVLRRLSDLPEVPKQVVEDAWRTATETAAKLRSAAARIETVEIAAAHAPPHEHVTLADGAGSLLAHVHQGVEAYRGMIAAAGRVTLAATPAPKTDELVEAAESLAGLAEALDDLATVRPGNVSES